MYVITGSKRSELESSGPHRAEAEAAFAGAEGESVLRRVIDRSAVEPGPREVLDPPCGGDTRLRDLRCWGTRIELLDYLL
jgi:hypothetical protein